MSDRAKSPIRACITSACASASAGKPREPMPRSARSISRRPPPSRPSPAAARGVASVGIDGVGRKEADRVGSFPGLLNYLPPADVARVLTHADAKKVRVRPRRQVDPDTVARSIWSTLNTARAMGLDLGKY